MKNNSYKKSLIFTIIILLIGTYILPNIYADSSNAETIYVDDDGGADYIRIQDAIDNASDGDIIIVLNGTYYENIIIDKTLSIIGEDKEDTIIDGMYQPVIAHLKKENVIIRNFTIRNSGGYKNNAGIKIDSENNQIINCIFYRTKTGILVNESKNNKIINCTFHTNGEGIFFKSSTNSKIIDCYFSHNAIGTNIDFSYEIKITGCYANTNGIGFFVKDSSYVELLRCAVYNNNDNQGGICLESCQKIDISNCNINHNGFGIKITDCSHVYVQNSDLLWNGHFAILIQNSNEEIEIKKCEITENFRFSIYVQNSNCKVFLNNIYNSLLGLYSDESFCAAKSNWWGSIFGPALFERKTKDRIYVDSGRVQFIPWLLHKHESSGANWNIDHNLFTIIINNSRYSQIVIPGNDSDFDHVPDWWEEEWNYNPNVWNDHAHLDPDNDGLNNIEECFTAKWNSSPYYKDVFLEFDWMEAKKPDTSNKPPVGLIKEMVDVFKNHNILLHVDIGSLGGGEIIPYYSNFSYVDLRDFYWDYFLHNDMNTPRKGIFHYCLICDYGPGPGFAFIGWDHLDSFDISAQNLQDRFPRIERDRLIVGGAIHELGHTFGLFADDYGGNDNRIATMLFTYQMWKYRNYKSCMNYLYTYNIIDFSDGSNGQEDFDDWSNLDFSFFKDTHYEWPR